MSDSNDQQWERKVLEKLAMEALAEQRRGRRWGIFFKLLGFSYLVVLLGIAMDWGRGDGIAEGAIGITHAVVGVVGFGDHQYIFARALQGCGEGVVVRIVVHNAQRGAAQTRSTGREADGKSGRAACRYRGGWCEGAGGEIARVAAGKGNGGDIQCYATSVVDRKRPDDGRAGFHRTEIRVVGRAGRCRAVEDQVLVAF